MFGSHTTLPRAGRDALAPCSIVLMLGACAPYPHSVAVNPAIEGRVLSAENGQPLAGARLKLSVSSDESWLFETVSDGDGRFSFAEHADFRLVAMLADAPACATVLSIQAAGYKPRQCAWMTPHWCNGAPSSTAFKALQLIAQDSPSDYKAIQAASAWPCNDPTAGATH